MFLGLLTVVQICPVQASERTSDIIYFNSFAPDDALERDDFIARVIADRIEEFDVAVWRRDLTRDTTHPDDLRLQISAVCEKSKALGCVRVSPVASGYNIYLVFFDGKATWKMTRDVESPELAVLAETTAMVVKGMIDAVRNQPSGMGTSTQNNTVPWSIDDRETIPAALPATRHEPHRFRVPIMVSAGYSHARMASDMAPSQGIEGQITIVTSKKLSFFAGYTGNWLSRLSDKDVNLRVRLHPVHLGFWYSFYTNHFALSIGAATGVIPTEIKFPTRLESYRQKGTTEWLTTQWSITPGVRGTIRLSSWLCLYLTLNIDILLIRANYTVSATWQDRVLLTPWPVMPHFSAGISFGQTGF
ncbi:MAG: hypothetical protein JXX14_13380 [Deltaproteobacteria bacterium]|nr:hypothetical protein [Deltaproteobacteria bacterium]